MPCRVVVMGYGYGPGRLNDQANGLRYVNKPTEMRHEDCQYSGRREGCLLLVLKKTYMQRQFGD